jgi:hypothetical protein
MPVNPSVALLVVGFFGAPGAPDDCSWFVISFSVLLGLFGFWVVVVFCS